MRFSFLILFFFCFAFVSQAQLKRFQFTENKMGSQFSIIIYSEDSARATAVSSGCFLLVDSLVNIFSDYIENSELNELCATAGTNSPYKCSPALFEILQLSEDAFKKSKGTFDITLGPLSRLWREARKVKRFPDQHMVKEKLQLTGFNKISMDAQNQTATLSQKGMQLDLGGIAQGYIGQQVTNYLKKQKVENALVDVSGDIVCIGTPPNTNGWTVAINFPASKDQLLPMYLKVSNQAVTTSGDVYQYIDHEGKRYSHVIDPSTGYGITSQRNVTVIADDGTKADWLTKACSILPISQAKKLAHQLDAAVLIIEMRKGKLIFHSSKNFKHFWKTITADDND